MAGAHELVAITRRPSARLVECELTYRDREPIDVGAALRQHEAYCQALEACGAQVERLAADERFPDGVFMEDTAVVLDEVGVVSMPGALSRRGEVEVMSDVLGRYREVRRLTLPATLEGGDVLRIGREIYVGQSSRTNAAGAEGLRDAVAAFGYTVIPVPVAGSLHLKTAGTALDDETILANTDWVDPAAFKGKRVLAADPAEPWAGNALRVDGAVLMDAACPRTMEMVSRAGYKVAGVDISEFVKAEAGLTCLSLVFKRQSSAD